MAGTEPAPSRWTAVCCRKDDGIARRHREESAPIPSSLERVRPCRYRHSEGSGLRWYRYLSQQALDIMVTLHTCAAGSRYVLPSRYDPDRCMSQATLNRVTQLIVERAKAAGLLLEPFTVHDLRRTGSTLLNEAGFNGEWIEKCLAHEEGRSSRSVCNKAEYAEQRRHMLQEWANMIDAWAAGERYTPTLCIASTTGRQLQGSDRGQALQAT